MLSVDTVLNILIAHFISDFVWQSDRMAVGKSKSFKILSEHVAAYTLGFSPFAFMLLEWQKALLFLSVNAILHFITDAITSRATSCLWQREQRHWFFVTIGLDQLIHYFCLLLTFAWVSQ